MNPQNPPHHPENPHTSGFPIEPPHRSDDLALAFQLAFEAGAILMDGLHRQHSVTRKGWRDLVSETDLASEAAVTRRLERERPDDGIHAEESSRRMGRSGRRWVIDPLDGTTNFIHGHPMFCVSIALEAEGEGRLGVIWAPYLGELFWAEKGRGGELISIRDAPGEGHPVRRKKLCVTETDALRDGLMATGFPYLQDERRNTNIRNFENVTLKARGIRRGGSAALDLAYVACGRFDGFWELYLNPWDVAAGTLLVREAGGRVTDVTGGEKWRDGWEVVATNGRLHDELSQCLSAADAQP
ncbi:MAG: inositol monophosphatase [Candidatus Eisenbacteria bacterium]|uniref:Inositol-1-monophosphatase n=1 Tax=Eiseniibacteriota bacterium TaxID=2212470 RepID=A0A948RY64_UNCEI|nr:inositol monophosphatase [Candidatus Eisenbacteria bacterium]MBU1950589.1 inositol monophosphatase [Candidatus Eisenbacteria bacterium]MBU2692616.1 inositol monophosphatase [Candidatus Eisenbacteria bacterium]